MRSSGNIRRPVNFSFIHKQWDKKPGSNKESERVRPLWSENFRENVLICDKTCDLPGYLRIYVWPHRRRSTVAKWTKVGRCQPTNVSTSAFCFTLFFFSVPAYTQICGNGLSFPPSILVDSPSSFPHPLRYPSASPDKPSRAAALFISLARPLRGT